MDAVEEILSRLPAGARRAYELGKLWHGAWSKPYSVLYKDPVGVWRDVGMTAHERFEVTIQQGIPVLLHEVVWGADPNYPESHDWKNPLYPDYKSWVRENGMEGAHAAAAEYLEDAMRTGEDPLHVLVFPKAPWEFQLKLEPNGELRVARARKVGSRAWLKPPSYPTELKLRFGIHELSQDGVVGRGFLDPTLDPLEAIARMLDARWISATTGVVDVADRKAPPDEVREQAERTTPAELAEFAAV